MSSSDGKIVKFLSFFSHREQKGGRVHVRFACYLLLLTAACTFIKLFLITGGCFTTYLSLGSTLLFPAVSSMVLNFCHTVLYENT